jgi:hypothetical protein
MRRPLVIYDFATSPLNFLVNEEIFLFFLSVRLPYTMFTYITNEFQTTFCSRGEYIYIPLVEVTVNSKEENSEDFCSNYGQEFGLGLGREYSKFY